jgi:hypothetical protein
MYIHARHAAVMSAENGTAASNRPKPKHGSVFTLNLSIDLCITYVTPPLLNNCVLQLHLVWWNVENLEVSTRSLPLVTFAILDDAQSGSFLEIVEIEVPFSICVSNELVWSLPTCAQSRSLT